MAGAYGWPAAVAEDQLEIRARLAALHAQIIAGEVEYRPFRSLIPAKLLAPLNDIGFGPGVIVTLRTGGEAEGELTGREDDRLILEAAAGRVKIPCEDVVGLGIRAESRPPE